MVNVTYQLFEVGHCKHCERVTKKTGRLRAANFPAIVALISHPTKGKILFDTGYSARFFQYTKYFPFSLYRYLTPVTLTANLKQQLANQSIAAEDINYIILSHLHADHIGGVTDFSHAKLIMHPDTLTQSKQINQWRNLLKGFIPQLLPADYLTRLSPIGKSRTLQAEFMPFEQGFDVFGDGSVMLVELPGHAKGQLGAILNSKPKAFLIADSCWHIDTILKADLPHKVTRLVHDNWAQYLKTITKLKQFNQNNPDIELIPSHCAKTFERLT